MMQPQPTNPMQPQNPSPNNPTPPAPNLYYQASSQAQPAPMNDIAPPRAPVQPYQAAPTPNAYQSAPAPRPYVPQPQPQRQAGPMPGYQPQQQLAPQFSASPQMVPNHVPAPSQPPAQSIPVRMPQQAPQQPGANPIQAASPNFNQGDEDEGQIEQLLQDVNSAVKKPEEVTKPKTSPLSALKKVKPVPVKLTNQAKKLVSQPKPALIAGMAVLTCISLASAAFFAFHPSTKAAPKSPPIKLVGTSAAASSTIKAGGGTVVNPNDIDTFISDSNTQFNRLHDDQDFNSNDLSDKALGL